MADKTAANDADDGRASALAAALYEDLRAAAREQMGGERRGHTLQPTALANEAWLRLARHHDAVPREQFLAVAATTLRRVLIDHARRRLAARRGGGLLRVEIDAGEVLEAVPTPDVLALDEALERLAVFAPEQARLVELRFFGGLDQGELSSVLGVSVATIERRWRLARAWLRSELEDRGS